jgi:hypothetical protein
MIMSGKINPKTRFNHEQFNHEQLFKKTRFSSLVL